MIDVLLKVTSTTAPSCTIPCSGLRATLIVEVLTLAEPAVVLRHELADERVSRLDPVTVSTLERRRRLTVAPLEVDTGRLVPGFLPAMSLNERRAVGAPSLPCVLPVLVPLVMPPPVQPMRVPLVFVTGFTSTFELIDRQSRRERLRAAEQLALRQHGVDGAPGRPGSRDADRNHQATATNSTCDFAHVELPLL